MTVLFWALIALMLIGALALVLRPLLLGSGMEPELARKLAALDTALKAGVLSEEEVARKRAEILPSANSASASRSALAPAVVIAIALPLAALTLYQLKGTPTALTAESVKAAAGAPSGASPHDGAGGQSGPDMEQAIKGLSLRLEKNPDDLEGWMLLGRALKQQQKFAEAKDALGKARARFPDDIDLSVEYSEALALAREDHLIEGEARSLLDAAVAKQPENQRALWLIGIADAQIGRYPQAVAHWEKLLSLLPPDSDVGAPVRQQIAEARLRAGMPPMADAPATAANAAPDAAQTTPTAPANPPTPPAAAGSGATLTVNVTLSPELAARVAPTDTLFVFARATQGPKMPLAIQKLTAAALPLTVTLTDGMGMMPQMNLSSVEQVIVGARISKSGNAFAQSGDLQILTDPVTTKTQKGTLNLVIKDVVP